MSKILNRLQARLEQALAKATVHELDAAIKSRTRWTKVANCSEAMGHILICVAMIAAFLASAYDSQEITIISGCTNVVSLAFVRFSRYAMDEARERAEIIRRIAKQQKTDYTAPVSPPLAPTSSFASLSVDTTDTTTP